MQQLGNGLYIAEQYEGALAVGEAELSTMRRLGASAGRILDVQNNLATTYSLLGRDEEALRMQRDVYSGYLKLHGEEHGKTLVAANNYTVALVDSKALRRSQVGAMQNDSCGATCQRRR